MAAAKPTKPTGKGANTDSKTSTATKTATSTKTSTEAYTQGNVTVTGGAGDGDTTVSIGKMPDHEKERKYHEKQKYGR